jgi:multiple sugar transport system permease protein
MPQTVSLVVVGLVWQVLLVDKIGLFNQFGAAPICQSISWLGDPASPCSPSSGSASGS